MQYIYNLISVAAGIYSLIILFRIIFTWFGKTIPGKTIQFFGRITDPYIDWWRKALNLRIGIFDISPVLAIASLSVVQSIFSMLARFDKVTIGNLLSIIFLSIWPVVSFILIFCFAAVILRLIAHITNRDINGNFWRMVDEVTQPVLYRINSIIFSKRTPRLVNGMIVSIIALGVLWVGGGFIISIIAGLLSRLPF
ncbi:MAG: YggT family protein [Treponema sp.]|nr:YggT family protein [Treponema sp.]